MRPGNARPARLTKSGSRTAAVPMITRETPCASQASAVAKSRMPPPSCTGMATAARMPPTAAAFIGRPAKAPSRSTTCRYSNPWSSNARACTAGSRLNTVARAMSPCSRRTHRPSLRSIAGNRITAPTRGRIGNQLQAQALAFFRMKLGSGKTVARHHGSHRTAVVGFGHQGRAVGHVEMKGVHEIGMQPVRPERNAGKQWVRPRRRQRVPSHVRDLQVGVSGRDPVDLAGIQPSPLRHLVLAAALGHQLHADADAEERPAFLAHRDVERSRPCRKPHRARAGNPRRRRRRAAPRDRRARPRRDRASPRSAGRGRHSRAARSNALAAECRLPEL